MSMKNEHYLERIRELEEDNTALKSQLSIAKKNLQIMSYLKRKYNAWQYEMLKVLSKKGMIYLAGMAEQGDTYKPFKENILEKINSSKQEASGEDISCGKDERSLKKHKKRQECLRGFEEDV